MRSTLAHRQLQSTHYDRAYYDEHRAAGLDYLSYGEWQRRYAEWLTESMMWEDDSAILDIGCACGSNLRGLLEVGMDAHGVDLSDFMVGLGRTYWPDMADRLHVSDAVNLHLFDDEQFDGLHSAQVAEHWKKPLVPLILRELARVTKKGGLFFCALDTTELFLRQGRNLEHEDPTHICVQAMEWWYERLREAGWRVCSMEYHDRLAAGVNSYLADYDWDWFVAQKVS